MPSSVTPSQDTISLEALLLEDEVLLLDVLLFTDVLVFADAVLEFVVEDEELELDVEPLGVCPPQALSPSVATRVAEAIIATAFVFTMFYPFLRFIHVHCQRFLVVHNETLASIYQCSNECNRIVVY